MPEHNVCFPSITAARLLVLIACIFLLITLMLV